MTVDDVQRWLARRLADVLSVAETDLGPGTSLDAIGLDSVSKAGLAAELEGWSGKRVEPEDIYAARDVQDLARRVLARWGGDRP